MILTVNGDNTVEEVESMEQMTQTMKKCKTQCLKGFRK